jgi:hypothetical protein
MTDSQLGFLYALVGLMALIVFVALESVIRPEPTSAQEYADRLCQELYGPQTQATWVADRLMCETARGEILPTKRPT